MSHKLFWTILAGALILLLPLSIGGCPELGLGSPTDGQSDGGDGGDGGDGVATIENLFDFDCGEQTVTAVPSAGYISQSMTYDIDVLPSGATLAKVLVGNDPEAAIQEMQAAMGQFVTLFEVGAGGQVLARHMLMETDGEKIYTTTDMTAAEYTLFFVVQDGCLGMESPDAADVAEDMGLTDLPEVQESPCGAGRLTITRDGPATEAEDGEDYICMSVELTDGCVDCWYADGAWHQRISYTVVYTALGSLSNVAVAGTITTLDGGADGDGGETPTETVNIAQGDTVSMSTTVELTHAESGSPESLGYEQLPTFDGLDGNGWPEGFDPSDYLDGLGE